MDIDLGTTWVCFRKGLLTIPGDAKISKMLPFKEVISFCCLLMHPAKLGAVEKNGVVCLVFTWGCTTHDDRDYNKPLYGSQYNPFGRFPFEIPVQSLQPRWLVLCFCACNKQFWSTFDPPTKATTARNTLDMWLDHECSEADVLDSLEPFAKAIERIHWKVCNKEQKPDITRTEEAHANRQSAITGIDDDDDHVRVRYIILYNQL